MDKEQTEMQLKNGFKTIVDIEDMPKISAYTWHGNRHSSGKVYVKGYVNGKIIRLHRFLMGADGGKLVVDHRDGNTLNNSKSNLRVCTQGENMRNQMISKVNTSGFKGVIFWKKMGKWRAQMTIKGRNIYGGYYESPVDAAKKYNELAIKHFGDFARLNKIPE